MNDLRVLLIDDEEELVATLEERLGLRGIHAETAVTVDQAMERVRHASYDVVVVDLKMPGLDGTEIVERIRAQHPKTGVLMITGHGSGHGEEDRSTHRGHRILLKPFSFDRLVRLIREAADDVGVGR